MSNIKLRVAIVGAGINGICIGWELAKAGYQVTIFERDSIISHTSRASSKLLHGGLRYLENGEFRLVREALLERHKWFQDAPSNLAKPLCMLLPVYRNSKRSRWLLKLGLSLYDLFARDSGLPSHMWLQRNEVLLKDPFLKPEGLLGAFQFWDGVMDDQKLGFWAAKQACEAGAIIHEGLGVETVDINGKIKLLNGSLEEFDYVINAAGPWSKFLLGQSGLSSSHDLDLVRGSHIVLNRPLRSACLFEVPGERRIFFVLPWQDGTLVGTTEVRQKFLESVSPSNDEITYLIQAYNAYFSHPVDENDIRETFAGVRPLVKSAQDPSRATREYALEKKHKLINVFGGKWTTARALARQVHKLVEM
ncbi:MAG: glycerol-3-phosphate dehydrogenase/oxidase [Pseudomonadota bacterium]